MNRKLFLIGLACAALSAVACSSSSRLSNSDIDRACALSTRCMGGSSGPCVTSLIDARARADANGCATEFANANRCYVRADSCSLTAACAEASDALAACSSRPVDSGTRSPDAGGQDAASGGDWVTRYDADRMAAVSPLCFDCPAVFEVGVCENLGLTPAEVECLRAVGNSHPAIRTFLMCTLPFERVRFDCVRRASLVTCPPTDVTSCDEAYAAGVRTCTAPSQTAVDAYNACFP